MLPFDTSVARIYGELHAALTAAGRPLADADLQIAATALRFNLELVTGNLRHFSRIPGLVVNDVLSRSREKEGGTFSRREPVGSSDTGRPGRRGGKRLDSWGQVVRPERPSCLRLNSASSRIRASDAAEMDDSLQDTATEL